MDVTQIMQSLTTDYASKIKSAATSSANSLSASGSTDTFDSIYNSALGFLNDTNTYIQDAQQAEVDFALGNITSTHELGVIQQKANLSLQYTVAIRDRIIEAYKEIMNIQI